MACVNLIPKIESHYWWKGNLETAREVLLLFKTTTKALPDLERHVIEHHPYETPEFIALPLSAGNRGYLRWLSESVGLHMGKSLEKSR